MVEVLNVKSLILDERWSEQVFIRGESSHITIRFCGVELGLTTKFMMVSVTENSV